MSDLSPRRGAGGGGHAPRWRGAPLPAGVTGAEVAADISKSLAKAALAVAIDGRLVRPVPADRRGRAARHRHRAGTRPRRSS